MGKQDLLIFPCSAGKEGARLLKPLPPIFIQNFIGRKAANKLMVTRDRVFKNGRKGIWIDRNTPPRTALALYSGTQYKVEGFKNGVAGAIRSGVHCLVISGGYGLIRAEESIHEYEAAITSTRKYWKDVIPEVLSDYVQRNQIGRIFIACSSSYANVLKRKGWQGDAKVYWCLPRLRPGEGGAMVKVPRLTGEAVVELIETGLQPSNKWKSRRPV